MTRDIRHKRQHQEPRREKTTIRLRRRPLTAAAFAALPVVSAQVKPGAAAADVALYPGADRLQKLDRGREEGRRAQHLHLRPDDRLGPVVAAFEKKYGIKVSVWRAGSRERAPSRRAGDAAPTGSPWTSSRPTAPSSSRCTARRSCSS